MANLPGYPLVTMQFALGSIGWSESHSYAATVDVGNALLYSSMKALALARTNALGGNVSWVQVKASQEGVNRDVAYLKNGDLPITGVTGYALGPPPPAMTSVWQSPHLSWPIKLQDQNQNQICITYIAGMPGSPGQTGPGPLQSTSWLPYTFLAKYADYLVAGPWGVASRVWPAGPIVIGNSNAATALTYVPAAGAAPAKFVVTCPLTGAGGNINVGSIVRFSGFKFNNPVPRVRLNGTYTVVATGVGTFTVNVARQKVDPIFVSPGGVQASSYTFENYEAYVVDNITHRKRGKVPLTPRGRR